MSKTAIEGGGLKMAAEDRKTLTPHKICELDTEHVPTLTMVTIAKTLTRFVEDVGWMVFFIIFLSFLLLLQSFLLSVNRKTNSYSQA